MGDVGLLDELAIVAIVGVVVTVALGKLRLPTVAGLLAAGALVGPYGLHLAPSARAIESLAEVGVVLLLFTIGLELSVTRLRDVLRHAALGGLVQIGLTVAATLGVCVALGVPVGRGLLYGFVFAMSSSAIVLRALSERGELDAPHGRFVVGALLLQDVCVVPMVLVVPLLAEGAPGGAAITGVAMALGKAAAVVAGTLLLARFFVPRVLAWVDASRSREVFLLAILGLCIGTAWVTSVVGLSLALGALLAGMVIADTTYGRRAMGDVLPLRDALVSVFFVSLGMLFDVRVVLAQPLLVLGLLVAFVLGKGLLAAIAALVTRFPARTAWLAGAGLAQFGEFGFVLTRLGQSSGVVDERAASPLLAAGIASMFFTPLLVRAAPRIGAGPWLLAPLERLLGARAAGGASAGSPAPREHVVVVGLGLAGRIAAEALRACGATFVVVELSAENVRQGQQLGLPVFYGDATSEEVLRHANVEHARLVLLLANDPLAVARIVDTLRRVAPAVPVLARTRYLGERAGLLALGARDVVAEEVEGAVEVVARTLRILEVPRNVIDAHIHAVRSETQTTERKATLPRPHLGELGGLAELKVEHVVVREGSPAAGASALSLRLRSETGALVVGVRRGAQLLDRPDAAEPFEVGDVVYFVGTGEAIARALPLFDPPAG